MAKIIFIDPSEALRRVYCEELEECGHQMVSLETRHKLLEVIEAENPDILILGVRPIGYGWQKLLGAVHERYPDLLIIFNTSLVELWEEALKLGATACFEKSSDISRLVEIVNETMAVRKQ